MNNMVFQGKSVRIGIDELSRIDEYDKDQISNERYYKKKEGNKWYLYDTEGNDEGTHKKYMVMPPTKGTSKFSM